MDSVGYIVFSLFFLVSIPIALAIPYPDNTNIVGIQLSQTCRTMHENNVTTNCPSYEDLLALGWEDSIAGSGEFYYDDKGFYKRGPPEYRNIHELYRYHDNKILIDPPTEIATRTKLIIINPSLPVYVPLGEYVKEDNKRILAKDRYVENCDVATITSENWQFLISDTIYYLRSDCTKTAFETYYTVEDYVSTMNKETSKQYKHDKWVKESIEKCKGICKEY